jgi:guanylate kinase
MLIPRRGTPLVVSAPSGAGKTTLCHRVVDRMDAIVFSISHTTRAPRPGEVDGVDYHFVSETTFDAMVAAGSFLEWAHVHGRRYGTGRAQAEQHLAAGTDVLFDIDLQGGAQIAKAMNDAVLVFILPPSMEALSERLRNRLTESHEEVEKRLSVAVQEIIEGASYTHFIVNDVLNDAIESLESVVRAERLRHVHRDALLKQVLGRHCPNQIA